MYEIFSQMDQRRVFRERLFEKPSDLMAGKRAYAQTDWTEYFGQEKIKENIKISMEAAQARGEA